jgi:hypothetical protein
VTALLLAPAGLSLLILGAHFLRAVHPVLMVAALALLALLFVRRRWAARSVQAALLLGALEWVRTTLVLTGERASMGRPFGRMVVILGAVAAGCALSALLFRAARVRHWFGMRAVTEPPA